MSPFQIHLWHSRCVTLSTIHRDVQSRCQYHVHMTNTAQHLLTLPRFREIVSATISLTLCRSGPGKTQRSQLSHRCRYRGGRFWVERNPNSNNGQVEMACFHALHSNSNAPNVPAVNVSKLHMGGAAWLTPIKKIPSAPSWLGSYFPLMGILVAIQFYDATTKNVYAAIWLAFTLVHRPKWSTTNPTLAHNSVLLQRPRYPRYSTTDTSLTCGNYYVVAVWLTIWQTSFLKQSSCLIALRF